MAKPYENTDGVWKYLVQAAKMARYLGLVRIADIADHKNPEPAVLTEYRGEALEYEVDTPDLAAPEVYLYGMDIPDIQPYHLEVWVEKSTMNDVLEPVCKTYGANLVTFEGEVSITACHDLLQRAKEAAKPMRVFYISDFDPAGRSMPVAMSRKVEFMCQEYGFEKSVKVKPIALLPEQVWDYHLPRTPIKESEKRAGKFENVFGSGATELDALEALHPGVLADLVSNALAEYYSAEAANEMSRARDRLYADVQAEVAEITAKYQSATDALQEMQAELKDIDLDAADYTPERHEPHVSEDDDWLFDSERSYGEQINAYKAFKNGDEL